MPNIRGKYTGVLLSEQDRNEIDDWRRAQRPIPGISETMRTLMKLGLQKSGESATPAQTFGRRKATK